MRALEQKKLIKGYNFKIQKKKTKIGHFNVLTYSLKFQDST